MKAENLGFKFLRKLGTTVMHSIIVSICLALSLDVCFTFKLAVSSFSVWVRVPLQTLFAFVAVNYFSAYALAIFSSPGRPPEPNYIDPICEKCQASKPRRTHHCSMCGQCCLRYDHHCPWVANCVGLRNYCHFLKFVTCGMLAGAISVVFAVMSICCGLFGRKEIHEEVLRVLASVIMPVFSFVSALCAGIMAFTHYPQVLHNETTVECYENEVELKKLRKLGMTFYYPYDNGLSANIREIFGENWMWTMLVPFVLPHQKTDGLSYRPKTNCGL